MAPTRGVIIYGKAKVERLSLEKMNVFGVSIFRKHMPEEAALIYAEGLGKLAEWVKITITPEKTSSFDYGKDDLYRKAVRGEL